jgi:hypothetical protein
VGSVGGSVHHRLTFYQCLAEQAIERSRRVRLLVPLNWEIVWYHQTLTGERGSSPRRDRDDGLPA